MQHYAALRRGEFVDRSNPFASLDDVNLKNPEYILNFALEQAMIDFVDKKENAP